MRCPRHVAELLRARMHRTFPHVRQLTRKPLTLDSLPADVSSLLEMPLAYDDRAIADIVVRNAHLLDAAPEQLQDIAIHGRSITRVGAAQTIAPLIGARTKVVDAKGKSVLPGWTDSHLHLAVAMQRLQGCDLEGVREVASMRERIAAFAARRSHVPVVTCFGLQYADPPIIPPDRCRTFLDQIVPERPLIIFAHDLHTCWANTKALEAAELLHPMPPYPPLIEALQLQKHIVFGSDALPSGEFHEPEVTYFISGPLAARFPLPIEQQLEDLKRVCLQLARLGLTSVHRMALAEPAQDIAFLLLALELEQRGQLPIRIHASCGAVADANMFEDVARAASVRTLLGQARRGEIGAAELHEKLVALLEAAGEARHDPIRRLYEDEAHRQRHPIIEEIHACSQHLRETIRRVFVQPHLERENPHRVEGMPASVDKNCKVRCDTVKIFLDGVVEKLTAYRLDQQPAEGIPEFNQEELNDLVLFADRAGMQVAAHAVGDGSVRSMIDAIRSARRQNARFDDERGHRIPHRIEHIEMCRAEDIRHFGEEQIVASMQPLHERPPMTLWHQMVPREFWRTAFAWESLLRSGAVLVFGSDWPIVSCDVREGVRHAVTRQPWMADAPEERVSLEEALSAYTTAPAYTEYSADRRGRIMPGMLADLVILSERIQKLSDEEDPQIDVRMTICDGQVVFEEALERAAPEGK